MTEKDVRAYDERSETFDKKRVFEAGRPHFTKPLRAHGKDGTYLELACGRAAHSLAMLRDGYHVVVSDVSPKSVEWVANTAATLDIEKQGAFIALDAQHLPFEDNSLDGVFMISSLHHMPNPLQTCTEVQRVLKPGGVFLVGYEPSRWSYVVFKPVWNLIKKCVRKNTDREVSIADDETDGFTMGQLHSLAKNAGFSSSNVLAVDFLAKVYEHAIVLLWKTLKRPETEYRPSCPPLQWIDALLAKIPLVRHGAWNYDLVAIK